MNILLQIGILFLVCLIGEGISSLLSFPIPASILSMLLLLILLLCRLLKIEHINNFSEFLLKNMAFFFIPAGVSIINYYDILKSSILPLLFICIVTTILTFVCTAYAVSFTIKLQQIYKKTCKKQLRKD